MSPVPQPLTSVSTAHVSPVGVPPLPTISGWYNPLPENYKQLDDRRHYLQNQNRKSKILEMHPNGTRGVTKATDYCILTILIVRIIGIGNKTAENLKSWNSNSERGPFDKNWGKSDSIHVIRSNRTGKYLCMDDQSVIYQARNYTEEQCGFHHEYDTEHYTDRYYRHRTNSSERWYIGINNDGTIRCGNITRKTYKGAQFHRNELNETFVNRPSTPFVPQKRKCCPKKACNRRRLKGKRKKCKNKKTNKKGDTDKITDDSKTHTKCRRRRRCYKNWCKKHRRKFFRLNLKELRRYYKRCIKKDKIRHCKNKRDR